MAPAVAMTMGTTMAMVTRTDTTPVNPPAPTLLQLMWLASPALPVGGFSYSEGLEAAVEAGLVHSEAQAAEWLSQQLQLALAPSSAPSLSRWAAACWSG